MRKQAQLIQQQKRLMKSQVKSISNQAGQISEDFDTLLKKLSKKELAEEVQEEQKTSGETVVIKQKDDVVYIADPNPSWKFGQPIKIGDAVGLTISLQSDKAIALLLKKQTVQGSSAISENADVSVNAGFGTLQTIFGQKIRGSANSEEFNIDMSKNLEKTNQLKRTIIEKQLFTGHMRLDLAQPLSKGNVIIFKGERNLGKSRLAVNTMAQFLKDSPQNRAIYVGLSKNNSAKMFEALPEQLKERASFLTVSGEDSTISDAEYFLLPKVGLQLAQSYLKEANEQQERNLLFVFDDILLHHFKERHIFDLANQPFAPVNIINHIRENTGVFKEQNYSMTSIFIVDKDSSSLMFKKDEAVFTQHIDSLSDQIIDFSSDRLSLTRGLMPVVEVKPDKTIIDYWQTPYLRSVKYQLQDLLKRLTESNTMHLLRKQMKMDEDPWDNYLIYDAKYFMQLLCHGQDLTIEQQILMVHFIIQSIREETMSQYKLKSTALIQELTNFARDFKDDDEDPSLLDKIQKSTQDFLLTDDQIDSLNQEIQRVIKMFYLQMKVKGQLKQYKDDYFV